MTRYAEQKKIEYLFIRIDQCQEFINKYAADLEKLLKDTKPVSIEDAFKNSESIHETVQELGQKLGFNKDVQALAKSQLRMTMKAMGKNPNLQSVLDKLSSFKGKYVSAHSTLTGYLACSIASHLEWGSEATFHKLTLAAFLHDITLNNHDLAACRSVEEAKAGNFHFEEMKLFKSHSADAAEIARRFQEVPPDVDAIIMQHHELPNGTGFPRGIGHTYIAPLSVVFIVAHEMAQEALKESNFDLPKFSEKMKNKYQFSQFKKVIAAIEKLGALRV